ACQNSGVWAWDCETKEKILIIPSVLAMLGDNPMQSEFACHIGLRGRMFCRVCKVQGNAEEEEADNARKPPNGTGSNESLSAPDASSLASDVSTGASARQPKKKKGKVAESMADMIVRITNFMKIGALRSGDETQALLRSQFVNACRIGGYAQYKRTRTQFGVKDTHQEALLQRLFDVSKKHGVTKAQKEAQMETVHKGLLDILTSPVWRIKDFDPHADTPVEILHVILLGFVKYFWRDAIARLKDDQKETLITRISSASISGLGISSLSGSTLVKYSGSLTGRDFRAIAQIAPFVLHGLLDKDILECWVALARLVPLVWQPQINKVDDHIADIEKAIDYLLDCVCRVTPRWFNKPKFHIVLHLPAHIRRFGPAMLFATEGFESFNAIIRSASVHSNRHAPSRDIAHIMARGNRVRHLLSGGFFLMNRLPKPCSTRTAHTSSQHKGCSVAPSLSAWMSSSHNQDLRWEKIGQAPINLISIGNFGAQLLGLGQADVASLPPGLCISCGERQEWGKTKSGERGPAIQGIPPLSSTSVVYTPRQVRLYDGDLCTAGDWIVWLSFPQGATTPTTQVGQVLEIIQVAGSQKQLTGRCDFLVVVTATILEDMHDYYRMPRIAVSSKSIVVTVDADAVKCVANVQHNCADHPCKVVASSVVYQEREKTDQRALAMTHTSPGDLILNTGQMRNSSLLRPLKVDPEPLDRQPIIMHSVKLEMDRRKKKRDAQAAMAVAQLTETSQVVKSKHATASTSLRQHVLST
ncbi:hypothetical protein BOTBODRAFT_49797, partial [Botryobasidium botryosum FD-172 SS1]